MAERLSRRRALGLAAALPAVGLGGCLSGPSPATGSGDGVVDRLRLEAEAVAPVTASAPGRVAVALANVGDEPVTLLYRRGIEAPLSAFRGTKETGSDRAALLPTEEAVYRAVPCSGPEDSPIPASRTDGCWRVTCDLTTPIDARGLLEVPAGDRVEVTYALFDLGGEDCLPAGTYRFHERVPAAVGEGFEWAAATAPGALETDLEKRLAVTLGADGSLSAEAELTAADRST